MGIAPYKYFTYDGESSRNYDVYLTGDGVFNAPERAVEMLEIPGRNGNYALDQGKFNNISVTYKAGIVDYSESNFANKVSAVRNWLCSKVGYKRLSDDYNPNEYRMAVYKSGVNIDHVDLKTGEFEITFECKPQRWLTSGETAVTVADGGTLDNPTPFEAEPLLAIKGYGTIGFNGYEIDVANATMGNVLINGGGVLPNNSPETTTIQADLLNTSDTFSIQPTFRITYVKNGSTINGASVSSTTGCSATVYHNVTWTIVTLMDSATFTKGTSSTASCSVSYTITTGSVNSCTASCSVAYDGDDTLTFSVTATSVTGTSVKKTVEWHDVYGNSSISILGNPTYIDCDIGECYMIKNSEIISLNQYIDLGSDLPKLVSGTNTFTYDNTVTELKVTPRWWKV